MKWRSLIVWGLLGIVLIFLAQNRHSRSGRFNYQSEIFSDKAGYQIYLSAFEYDWNARNFKDTALLRLSGYGFEATTEGKILTKYTYGTALAYSPFYLIGKGLEPKDENYPGFSVIQNRMISLAAPIYLLIGLIFLYRFLRYTYRRNVSIWTLVLIGLGTNVLYYGVQETGMSHVYSFALFTVYLWFLRKTEYLKSEKKMHFFLLGMMIGWMIAIRQLNIVFPLVFFFLDLDADSFKQRWKRLFRFKNGLFVFLGVALLILPQLVYWKYASGHWIKYSYGEEGFDFLHPKILAVWFSPYNGLFLYTPLVFFMLIGAWMMHKNKDLNGRVIWTIFLGLSFLFASWWAWWFGCAFGARSFVEYYSLFSMGLAFLIQYIMEKRNVLRLFMMGTLIICAAYTLKMSFSVSPCYPGEKNWDWKAFPSELMAPMH
ncbi:MAG: hypothetical protein GC180_10180 [Bacteroidetes bacterium]|nr:hypothetical protein [Bacteroidota bacterium]